MSNSDMREPDDLDVDSPGYGAAHDSPNTDFGNMADPPADSDTERISDDNDLEPEGSGLEDTPMRWPYEGMALRDDLARSFEELLIGMREWADEDGSEAAGAIVDDLEEIYERLGEPSEETSAE